MLLYEPSLHFLAQPALQYLEKVEDLLSDPDVIFQFQVTIFLSCYLLKNNLVQNNVHPIRNYISSS